MEIMEIDIGSMLTNNIYLMLLSYESDILDRLSVTPNTLPISTIIIILVFFYKSSSYNHFSSLNFKKYFVYIFI